MIRWHLEIRKVAQLKPYQHNPRRFTEQGMLDLEKSIAKFGMAEPIVVNLDDTVIGGHARYFSLKKRGTKEADCWIPDRMLTEAEVKELNVRLNKNIAGAWDFDILANNFDLPDLLEWGFTEKELDLDQWKEEAEDTNPPEVDASISQAGDVILLDGTHRILCGSSTDNYPQLMDGQVADLVFTDPPYNVNYVGGTADELTIQGDAQKEERFRAFLFKAFRQMNDALKLGGVIYVCHADSTGHLFRNAMLEANFILSSTIIWNKNSLVAGHADYQYKHEPILYGWKEGTHNFYGDRTQTTVWDFPRPTKNKEHPNMKPIELVQKAIENSSRVGEIVLDPFLGSGSSPKLRRDHRLNRTKQIYSTQSWDIRLNPSLHSHHPTASDGAERG